MAPKRKKDEAAATSSSSIPQIFVGMNFLLGKSIATKDKKDIEEKIEKLGGSILRRSSARSKVDYWVCDSEDIAEDGSLPPGVEKAVSLQFVHDSEAAGSIADPEKYTVKPKETVQAPKAEEKGAKSRGKKKKEDDAAEPKPKRSKKVAEPEPDEPDDHEAGVINFDSDTVFIFDAGNEPEDEPKKKKGKKGAKASKAEASAKAAAKAEAEESDSEPATTNVQSVKLIKKGRAFVEPLSNLQDSCHVFEEGQDVYSVMLNQTDINYNVKGHNKFYQIQLLVKDKGNLFYVFTRWGRVGVPGQQATEPCADIEAAKKGFKDKFKAKTGNQWDNRANFTFVKGKYDMVELDAVDAADESGPSGEAEKKPARTDLESKLDPRVKDFMSLISDTKMWEQQLIEMEIDLKKMPLGKLSKKQIKEGYEILTRIQAVIEGKGLPDEDTGSLSSRFYTKIPHDFGFKRPPSINSLRVVKIKMELLETLGDLEIATKLINEEASSAAGALHPLDAHYKSMHVDMRPLPKDSKQWEIIEKMVRDTHAPTHASYSLEVVDLFEVDREGELERAGKYKDLHNHQLLWHGSRLTNWMGILSQGLRIAPPEAPSTGYMFGKGVYFADLVSKSANYCSTSASNNTGVLLLCDVALGNTYDRTAAEFVTQLPQGKHSTKGCGKQVPDVKGDLELEPGLIAHTGPITKDESVTSGHLMYNEYIVYDIAQIQLRYLVRLKFNYKKY